MVCFRYTIVNILHRDENMDDDNDHDDDDDNNNYYYYNNTAMAGTSHIIRKLQ
jgi:hypothetical protein